MQTPRPSDQPSIRDEIASVLAAWRDSDAEEWAVDMYRDAADRILASPVIRRIQADALRDAALSGAFGTGAQATLMARAERIEKGDDR